MTPRGTAAEDKLAEAAFFLKKLKRANVAKPAFRYYLSALLSAARSVTWVLQADYRTKHREQFDGWYERHQRSLAESRLARVIVDARNSYQKRGMAEAVVKYVWDSPLDTREGFTIEFESGGGSFKRAAAKVGTKIGVLEVSMTHIPGSEDAPAAGETSVWESPEVQEILPEMIARLEELRETTLNREPAIILALVENHSLPLAEFWPALEGYLKQLGQVVAEAKTRFGTS